MMRIYLDHAASTPLKPAVLEAMLPYCTRPELLANPSSAHADGRAAHAALDQLRSRAAVHFDCQPGEVIFNSGGSEGDNHALLGVATLLASPIHLAISTIEHEAVVKSAEYLQASGHRVSHLPVTGRGELALEVLEQQLRDDPPDLLSLMAVNNETGVVQPVLEAAQLCREHGVLLHCDAVRAVGHGLPQLQRCQDIALLNCTAHKFGGPRGVGLLVARGELLGGRQFPPLLRGGGQEGGRRAGTENLVAIAGLISALELATEEEAARVEALRAGLEGELLRRWPHCVLHGGDAPRATHITSVAFPGANATQLQQALDARGLAVGTGSACHEGATSSSPVLAAMGVPLQLARGTLRISLGWHSQAGEITALLDALAAILPV
jgi:cysteine desulfurase